MEFRYVLHLFVSKFDSFKTSMFCIFVFQSTSKKHGDECAVNSEETGKVPSDIHISRVDKADSNPDEVIKTDTNVGGF